MVLAFGLDHIILATDRPKDPNASRYLETTAATRGKPSITVEAGRAGRVDPADIDSGRDHVRVRHPAGRVVGADDPGAGALCPGELGGRLATDVGAEEVHHRALAGGPQ